jgi:hypothetical protein
LWRRHVDFTYLVNSPSLQRFEQVNDDQHVTPG